MLNDIPNSSLVLIVDDHQPAAEMASQIFKKNGYEVLVAYNGVEGLEKAVNNIPDLILLDVMMPGLNGFEVLEQLRAKEETANIPTILVTAKDGAADIEHGLRLGADDYLPKPFDPRVLLARAHSKIESRQLRDQLQRRTKELQSLLRVGEELSFTLDIHELQNLIVYLILDLLPSDVVGLLRLDDNGVPVDVIISQKGGISITDQYDASALFEASIQHTKSKMWLDQQEAILPDMPFGIIVPLEQLTEIHGYIILGSNQIIDESHLRVLQGIAAQASLALRNAELFELKANYADHLEETVQERTAELRKAHEMLVRSERLASIGQLAAAFAHEINNPLMPIVFNLEGMLEDIDLNVPIKTEDIQVTIESAKRIERMIKRLLGFTRKRNQDKPDGELLHLDDVIQGVIELSIKHFEHSGVQIHSELPHLKPIFGSPDQLEQVFLNIMLNARDAMPDGGKLFIEIAEEGGYIVTRMIDTGIGIEEDKIGHIFEPFVSHKEDGTGLGLFITHEVIQNHDGLIEVFSKPNEGTRFIVRLPIWQDD